MGLIIPIGLLVFFSSAPGCLNSKLHDNVATALARDTRLTPAQRASAEASWRQIDFVAVCGSSDPADAKLAAKLRSNGICGQIERLQWGLRLSVVLVAVLLAATGADLWLNRRARASQAALISSYRLGWKITLAAALMKVLLLIPLLAYGVYELTTLSLDRYFPKFIAMVVIGGLIALWKSAQVLLQSPPLEFEEAMSRRVAPEEAPELWAAVRAAAERLHTAPPDNIVIGMQLNFYVTELAVLHGGGRAEGRTLFLSYPLLKELSPDEVLAIVGHELGHFIGEDTRLTREFYPLRLKANGTLDALAQSGWVGWPSLHVMSFFNWAFGATEQAMSRARELLADRKAAELTDAPTMARALVRFHAASEAFDRTVFDANKAAENPLVTSLGACIRGELAGDAAFWQHLFEATTPHPLDSHPPLRDRLESLGVDLDADRARQMAMREQPTAFSAWLGGRDSLFGAITEQAAQAIARVRRAHAIEVADPATDEGRRLLAENFPERTFGARKAPSVLVVLIGALVALGLAAGALVADDVAWRLILGGLAIAAGIVAGLIAWQRRGATLVLRYDRLEFSVWKRPLLFADVADVTATNSSGSITVTFHLKAAAAPYGRTIFPGRRKRVRLGLALFDVKQPELLELIRRYYTRTAS